MYTYIHIYIYIYICMYIYIWRIRNFSPPPTLDPSVRRGAGLGTPPPYFEVGKHKKMGFGLGWDSGRAVDRVFGLKIGYDITAGCILTRVLKITTKS